MIGVAAIMNGLAAAPAGPPGPDGGWSPLDIALIVSLPVLIVISAFFSGSETALFGLNESQRMLLRQHRKGMSLVVESLLADQRMLLITLLLGNTTINVFYFVITSVILMRAPFPPAAQGGLAVLFLLLIVLGGEVGPKVLATASRVRTVAFTARLLYSIHRAILPLRLVLDGLVITPFSRLTAPPRAPERLHDMELKALLEISSAEGTIDPEERQMLRDVVDLGRLRVRDIMTPRVEMIALPDDASRDDVQALLERHGLSRIPVYAGDIDNVIGILHVKRFLLAPSVSALTDPSVLTPPRFVPDLARLDQLLERLRAWGEPSAIVVDEYGGTDGIVAVEDIVAELVGDLIAPEREDVAPPRLVGIGRWRVSGAFSAREWCDAFGVVADVTGIATVGGLLADRIGRRPEVGDVVRFADLEVQVSEVGSGRVLWVEASLREAEADDDHDDERGGQA